MVDRTAKTSNPWRTYAMRPLQYSINITLDGCCDHRAIPAEESCIVKRSRTSTKPMPSSLGG